MAAGRRLQGVRGGRPSKPSYHGTHSLRLAGRHLRDAEIGFAIQLRANVLSNLGTRPGTEFGIRTCPMSWLLRNGKGQGCAQHDDCPKHLMYGCKPRFTRLYTDRHDKVCSEVARFASLRGVKSQSTAALPHLTSQMCQNGFPAWVRALAGIKGEPALRTQRPDLCFWDAARTKVLVVEVAITSPGRLLRRAAAKQRKYAGAVLALGRGNGPEVSYVSLTVGGAGELVAKQIKDLCAGLRSLLGEPAAGVGPRHELPKGPLALLLRKWGRLLSQRLQAASIRGSFAIYLIRKKMTNYVSFGRGQRRTVTLTHNEELINQGM